MLVVVDHVLIFQIHLPVDVQVQIVQVEYVTQELVENVTVMGIVQTQIQIVCE